MYRIRRGFGGVCVLQKLIKVWDDEDNEYYWFWRDVRWSEARHTNWKGVS